MAAPQWGNKPGHWGEMPKARGWLGSRKAQPHQARAATAVGPCPSVPVAAAASHGSLVAFVWSKWMLICAFPKRICCYRCAVSITLIIVISNTDMKCGRETPLMVGWAENSLLCQIHKGLLECFFPWCILVGFEN